MSQNTIRKAGMIVVLATALVAPALSQAPAIAKGGSPAVQARGACAGGGVWKLKAKHDNGRIQVEYEVDTNRVGQLWRVGLTDNTHRIFLGNKRTTAPSGSFTVRVLTANRAGTDVIRAHATLGSRVCGGTVRL